MRVVNLTSHVVRVKLTDGTVREFLPANQQTARTRVLDKVMATLDDGVPVVKALATSVLGLPEPTLGEVYLVSTRVASAARRVDVVCPDTENCVRNQDGSVQAVTQFRRFA